MKTAIEMIAAERWRQIEGEGWTPKRDDNHTDEELAIAAATYAMPEKKRLYRGLWRAGDGVMPHDWPFEWDWKPTPGDRIRELVKAGALIVAEIDRLMRAGNS